VKGHGEEKNAGLVTRNLLSKTNKTLGVRTMKTQLISLTAVALLLMVQNASAAIFVHAGPVTVGIRPAAVRPIHNHWGYIPPVVTRPVTPVIRPIIAPAPVLTPAAAAIRAARIRNAIEREVQEGIENALNN
jgi:hypothetical protein